MTDHEKQATVTPLGSHNTDEPDFGDSVAPVIQLDSHRPTEVDTASPDLELDPDYELELRQYSRADLVALTGESRLVIKRLTDELMDEFPDSFCHNDDDLSQPTITFGYAIANEVARQLPPPKDWLTASALAERLNQNPARIKRLMRSVGNVKDPVILRYHIAEETHQPAFHISPELAADIEAEIIRRDTEQPEEEVDPLQEDFESFAAEIREGMTLESQEFVKLIGLFGDEHAADLLMHMRPDYKHLPTGVIRSFLSDFLGDFAVSRGSLNFDRFEGNIELLANGTLRDALVEVVKRDCLSYYHRQSRANPGEDEFSVIAEYIADIQEKTADIDNKHLKSVIKEVEEYYISLFVDFDPPERMVDSLRSDRPFPDLNQRINIKEIIDKRRMLIADDPGGGKSASAIIAKEVSGAKTMLLTAPSSVLDKEFWQVYLSDNPPTENMAGGYFKPGQAPKVLEVKSLADLEGVEIGDYEYVLLSHERLTEEYVDALCTMGFDMLDIDESHKLKNLVDGERAKQLVRLAQHLEERQDPTYTVMLTGTPAPNKVSDIAMVMRLLYPKEFGHRDSRDLAKMMIEGDIPELRSFLIPRMQMKKIEDFEDIPPIIETIEFIEISEEERILQEVVRDDDEVDFSTKIQTQRKMLLNPATVEAYPPVVPSKAVHLNKTLNEAFDNGQRKVAVFVNDFRAEVLSGNSTIADFLDLPADVQIRWIHGGTEKDERNVIQKDFQEGDDRTVLIVNGMITDVGVDYSAADGIIIHNWGWMAAQIRQEIGRGQRPGRKGSLTVTHCIAAGTIEEGMYYYALRKDAAIKKLLQGVPLSDMDMDVLFAAEDDNPEQLVDLEVNADLANYYFSQEQRLLRMIATTKEQGQQVTKSLVDGHGHEYARTYSDLVSRSYQANMARLSASIIEEVLSERPYPPNQQRIVDLGSGPEMLRRHISDGLAANVISMDLNSHHFLKNQGKPTVAGIAQGTAAVASIVSLQTDRRGRQASAGSVPLASKSADVVNVGLVLDATKYFPSKQGRDPEALERLETFKEINRILKPGGHAVISLIYSLDLDDEVAFNRLAKSMGFQVVSHFSGLVTSEKDARGRMITLKKERDCPEDTAALVKQLGPRKLAGLKFSKSNSRPKNNKRFDRSYTIQGKNRIVPRFNSVDQRVADEEAEITTRMHALREEHGTIAEIPEDRLMAHGLARALNSKRYLLFKRLTSVAGAVFIKDDSAR